MRAIRNTLEASGSEPILFFLKCVSESDELDSLLKREIEARNFFLLCDSANARESKWVQDEIAHVRQLDGRKIEVIDLDGDWESQMRGVSRLVRESRIFMSHARADMDVAIQIADHLRGADFAVYTQDKFAPAAEDIQTALRRIISETMQRGYFLHFLSAASLSSRWCRFESEFALELDPSRYIPILLTSASELSQHLPVESRSLQWIDGAHQDSARIAADVIRRILR